ncbi:MAG TPA: HAD-IA family hydrolase [Anaerolineaceae bacterium]|nr:HAD-IA family hydrolase [Anaerolineaceae bacterium]HPN51672.1 HAD-IA family hydrolase [Anaerolineaceae bacterium]
MQALIFDFDGLILDTELPEFLSWQQIYQSMGHELPFEMWCRCIGTSASAFDPIAYLHTLAGSFDQERIIQDRHAILYELLGKQSLLPGVLNYFQDAKKMGLKLAVASSSPLNWVSSHLRQHHIDHFFDAICTREDVAVVKPNPALYQTALRRLQVNAEDAIAFEDSPNGIKAAVEAGIYCVAVPNQLTSRMDTSHANMHIASFASVPLQTLLRQLAVAAYD